MAETQLGAGAFLLGLLEKNFGSRPTATAAASSSFVAGSQAKAQPVQSGARLDSTPANSKKPAGNLGSEQRIATSGETVPIVFGKRVNNIGGVWVQPPMIKTGTNQFVGSFLYTISQGDIVSSPVKHLAWVGLRNVAFLDDQTITLAHDYATAASLETTPNVCPIGGSTLYCGIQTYSYLQPIIKAEINYVNTESFIGNNYQGWRIITRGTGDTSNSVFGFTAADVEVFDAQTGADVTAAWLAYTGYSPSLLFIENYNFSTGGGRTVGTILDDILTFGYTQIPAGLLSALGIDPSGKVIFKNTITYINNQYNPSLPASTGTLEGVQYEYITTPYPDPAVTPTANNSAYADITFLRVTGNIYDPPSEGSYPTSTRQLFIFYEQGISVDLYSAGLVGGVYSTGASNQFVDFAMYLFTLYKRANGAATAEIATPIYVDNLPALADFADEYNLHFNGILQESVNIVDYLSTIAPFFFLAFLSIGGQYEFQPILPLNGSNQLEAATLTPTATFTEDEILPGSYSKTYKGADDRRDFIAVMLWRESNPAEIGIQRTLQVAYSTTELDAPVEQFDMTDFCCDSNHATMYGKYQLARRKYSTHNIAFQVALLTTALKPTDVIKIERQRVSSRGDNRQEIDWYQVTSIKHSSGGVSTIEAEHFPVDGSDVSLINDSILNGAFRIL